jgi:hypothetical protein
MPKYGHDGYEMGKSLAQPPRFSQAEPSAAGRCAGYCAKRKRFCMMQSEPFYADFSGSLWFPGPYSFFILQGQGIAWRKIMAKFTYSIALALTLL